MAKRFTTTGLCIDKKDYMVNIDKKLSKIEKLIEDELYFTINRPRQFGKTTTLFELEKRLKDKYLVISTSFEGIGDIIFESEERFSSKILGILSDALEFEYEEESDMLRDLSKDVRDLNEVSKRITKFIKALDREVILMIDEVDKSSNNQLFLSFLGMLRNKYLLRNSGKDLTFKSVILAGVHDVKSLKLKLRPEDEKKYNSPWNIAIDFDIDMNFSSQEIETMLIDYDKDYNLNMDIKALSERIYFFTSGYPYLVSRICQHIDEKFYSEVKEPWKLIDIDRSVKIILGEQNTLFDSMIKNLENYKELYDYIEDLIVACDEKSFNIDNPLVNLGIIYGYLKNEDGKVKVSNRIFNERIFNYMSSKTENKVKDMTFYNFKNNFITPENGLNVKLICQRFQKYMKENYSSIDKHFLEREGRLIFGAFIAPIINGVGFTFKEVQISEEKRLDIVIAYNSFKYIIELKIWRGEQYNKYGLEQLCNYLDIHGLDKGYLISFNFNKGKEYSEDVVTIRGKEIFSVMV